MIEMLLFTVLIIPHIFIYTLIHYSITWIAVGKKNSKLKKQKAYLVLGFFKILIASAILRYAMVFWGSASVEQISEEVANSIYWYICILFSIVVCASIRSKQTALEIENGQKARVIPPKEKVINFSIGAVLAYPLMIIDLLYLDVYIVSSVRGIMPLFMPYSFLDWIVSTIAYFILALIIAPILKNWITLNPLYFFLGNLIAASLLLILTTGFQQLGYVFASYFPRALFSALAMAFVWRMISNRKTSEGDRD